jgi:hypothetical protein
MAVWRVRLSTGVREGLTQYQVQELIRSGQLRAEDQVEDQGAWRPLAEVPALARFLPASSSQEKAASPGTMVIHGLVLRTDKDGKPIPPSQEEMLQLLAAEAAATRIDRTRGRRIVLLAAVLVVASLIGLVLFTIIRSRS